MTELGISWIAFNVLRAFGFGGNFTATMRLHTGASVMLQMGDGPSYPVPVNRGIGPVRMFI